MCEHESAAAVPSQMAVANQLKRLGVKLATSRVPSPSGLLTKLLEQAVLYLCQIEQSPRQEVLEAILPSFNAFLREDFLNHEDEDVKVLLAYCLCEFLRITVDHAPYYSDDILRGIHYLIVSTYSGLSDLNSQSFGERVTILETNARYQIFVMMLDIECDDLITDMFRTFLEVVSDKHAEHVVGLMQKIMFITIEESDRIQESLLSVLFSALRKTGAAVSARKLASNVLEHTAGKFKSVLTRFIMSSLTRDAHSSNGHISREIISEVYQCAPKVFEAVVPSMTGELLADEVGIRFKAVELIGELFALPRGPFSEYLKPLFTEFLNRLADIEVTIRVSVIKVLKRCLILNHSHLEASEIIKSLHDKLSDHEENVRMEAVAALCDVACYSHGAVPVDTIKAVALHLHDESWVVKSYTMEGLVGIYKVYFLSVSNGSTSSDEFDWIPGQLFRCFLDKNFRNLNSDLLSSFLNHLQSQFLPAVETSSPSQSKMLDTYKELLLANTNELSDNAKMEHMMALKCLRLRLFGGNA
ncbi:unnamed protein product [Urochloa humidicola]